MDGALDRLLALTGSRFVMVSSVDVRDKAYNMSRFYGADAMVVSSMRSRIINRISIRMTHY
ncbi:hypothetical protein AB5I41_27180 [Sphingomonas sp. MMS24-JH45]